MDRGSQLSKDDEDEDNDEEEEEERRTRQEEAEEEEEKEEEEAIDIKSNNPDLAGGEKISNLFCQFIRFYIYIVTRGEDKFDLF